ncbi:MAG: undecaprenyl diphosphate synthase family protein [Methanothrix sp.]
MIYRLYEHLLQSRIKRSPLPGCVAVVLSSGDLCGEGIKRLGQLLEWSRFIGLSSLIIYVNEDDPGLCRRLAGTFASYPARINLHTAEGIVRTGLSGSLNLDISLGYGGKREVAEAFRYILREVESGRLESDQIDEKTIESHLRFSEKPDVVIRAGGKRLSDFMIWQAAYSELYFTDVNWQKMRKIDFLRAIRDCQRRERRFGR